MKERMKKQKGITLIALIITIVVLMILAAVAINSIRNDGIIGKAEGAANKYTEEQQKEQVMLDYYESLLAGTAWTQNGTTVSRKGQTLKVGDSVKIKVGEELKTYKELGYDGENTTYTGEWVVLGAEYGKLLLVSATNVQDDITIGGKEGAFNDYGKNYVAGFYDGIQKLDSICSVYLNNEYADKARSITVEDIDRVTGAKPSNYEQEYTFTREEVLTGPAAFVHIDGREIGKNGVTSIPVTNTAYSYSGAAYADTTLFNQGSGYWLATQCVRIHIPHYVQWGFFAVDNQDVSIGEVWSSYDYEIGAHTYGVRAVVSLKSNVQVDKV